MRKIATSAFGLILALRILLKPKDGIYALIRFGNLLTGMKAYEIAVETIKKDEESRKLIEERYSKGMNELQNFSHYEEGTLGGEYYRKMRKLNLVCYPIKIQKDYSEVVYTRERRREIHDLLHVVLSYNTTLIGEASLNSFLLAKAKMPTCIFIVVGIILRTMFKNPGDLNHLLDSIVMAYSRGKKAKSPFSMKWEEFMDSPIDEVRTLFGV